MDVLKGDPITYAYCLETGHAPSLAVRFDFSQSARESGVEVPELFRGLPGGPASF